MPEGQFTGSRGKYTYENDAGQEIVLRLDTSLVITGSGLAAFNPTTDTTAIPKPLRFKPRGVYWQATEGTFAGKRKFLVCGEVDATNYASDTPLPLTVDGVAGITTGRRGEVQSYA